MDDLYFACPPFDVNRVSLIHKKIEEWLRSDALTVLVNKFGTKVPENLDLASLVDWLEKFSDNWDFRRLQREVNITETNENARWLISESNDDQEEIKTIKNSSKALNLIGRCKPDLDSYDYIIPLGGARYSCYLRPLYANSLIVNNKLKANNIVLLASSRPISESERDATDTYSKNTNTEFDLINSGAEVSFNLKKNYEEESFLDTENVNRNWVIRKYKNCSNLPPIISISAPSTEPDKRRANSADTFNFFLSKFSINEKSTLLLITSQISLIPHQFRQKNLQCF